MKERKDKHKKVQQYIWNRKNKPFLFGEMKKAIHGYSFYGGRKYLVHIKEKYGLKSFKKDGRVWLQKISTKQEQEQN